MSGEPLYPASLAHRLDGAAGGQTSEGDRAPEHAGRGVTLLLLSPGLRDDRVRRCLATIAATIPTRARAHLIHSIHVRLPPVIPLQTLPPQTQGRFPVNVSARATIVQCQR